MFTNIKSCSKENILTILTNTGHRSFKKEVKLKFLPISVHFNKESMATILILKDFSNLPRVQINMDSDVEKAINVFTK